MIALALKVLTPLRALWRVAMLPVRVPAIAIAAPLAIIALLFWRLDAAGDRLDRCKTQRQALNANNAALADQIATQNSRIDAIAARAAAAAEAATKARREAAVNAQHARNALDALANAERPAIEATEIEQCRASQRFLVRYLSPDVAAP